MREVDWGVSRAEVAVLGAVAFFALFVPVLGALLALIGAWDRNGESRRGPAIAFAVLALVAAWLSVRPLVGL